MVTLRDFLLARIGEDETAAKRAAGATAWHSDEPGVGTESYVLSRAGERLFTFDLEAMARSDASTLALGEHIMEWLPGRVLDECETKRAILERWASYDDSAEHEEDLELAAAAGLAAQALFEAAQLMALIYDDHADYDEAWRPRHG